MNDIVKQESSGATCKFKAPEEKKEREEKNSCYEILPAMEAFDDENGVEIILEVPGSNGESTHIEVEEGQLAICAGSRLTRNGIPITYKRALRLSDAVDIENISACTKDGLLKITLPKAEKAKVHHIPVK